MGDAAVGSHPEQGVSLRSSSDETARSRARPVGRLVATTVLGIAVLTGCGDDAPPDPPADTGNESAPELADPQDPAPHDEDGSPPDDAPDAGNEDPTDIRATEWDGLTWQASCDTTTTIDFKLARDESGERRYTATVTAEDVDTYFFSVDVDEVVYGDVNGDGQEEAAFLAFCIPGNYAVETVEAWSLTEGGLGQLPPIVTYDPRSGTIAGIELADGAVRITTSEPDPADDVALIEGAFPVEVVTDWRLVDERWEATEVSRKNSDPGTANEPDLTARGFVLPSGNIACERAVNPTFDIDDLACVILSGTQPPLANACDEREAMWLPLSDPAQPGCERANPVDIDQPTLSYGARWANEGIACVSSETGLECANEAGHGFWLSRHGWRTW